MAEEKAVQQDKKPEPRLVPETDVIAVKKAHERTKAELSELKAKLVDIESERSLIGGLGDDEEEVDKVKTMLLEREKALNKRQAQLDKDLTSLKEREKESRVQSLVSKYGVNITDISDSEDPEKKALELYAERLTKEKEELVKAKEKSPELIYESGSMGKLHKQPRDMTEKEFEDYVKSLRKRGTLSKV